MRNIALFMKVLPVKGIQDTIYSTKFKITETACRQNGRSDHPGQEHGIEKKTNCPGAEARCRKATVIYLKFEIKYSIYCGTLVPR
jgi:hypothetical protein